MSTLAPPPWPGKPIGFAFRYGFGDGNGLRAVVVVTRQGVTPWPDWVRRQRSRGVAIDAEHPDPASLPLGAFDPQTGTWTDAESGEVFWRYGWHYAPEET